MAFTTIPGGDLADIILLGSEAADTVVLNTSQSIIANGFGGDDSITIANPVVATGGNISTFTAPSTIYGGEGNDSILLGTYTVGSSQVLGGAGNDFFGTAVAPAEGARPLFDYQAAEVNGNEGEDTFGAAGDGITANGSQILGGANNDTIFIGASTNTEFNGNKNLDRLTVLGAQTGGSIFGGKGTDFLTLGDSVVYTGTSISGADGNDTISDGGLGVVIADNSTLTVLGGQGVDNITITLEDDGSGVAEAALIGGGTEDDFITITNGAAAAAVTASRVTIQGGEGADTITGFGNLDGGAGADSISNNGGTGTNFLYSLSTITDQTGLSTSTIDTIAGFVGGGAAGTFFKTGVAGTGTNFANGNDQGTFALALNEANRIFTQVTAAGDGSLLQYVVINDNAGTDDGQWVFFKNTTTFAGATAAVQINDTAAAITFANFIA